MGQACKATCTHAVHTTCTKWERAVLGGGDSWDRGRRKACSGTLGHQAHGVIDGGITYGSNTYGRRDMELWQSDACSGYQRMCVGWLGRARQSARRAEKWHVSVVVSTEEGYRAS